MSADIDEEWEKDKRRRRYQALREDGPLFGLVPNEEAELEMLSREFETEEERR